MPAKDYALLAKQPASVSALNGAARNGVVISAVIGPDGKSLVISRYGDVKWRLWPFFEQSNVKRSDMTINWEKVPKPFREACKAALYRYWIVGRPGVGRPTAKTLSHAHMYVRSFTRYLENLGIRSFAKVERLHISNYVHELKNVQQSSSITLTAKFRTIEILHLFADEHPEGLAIHPWPGSSALEMAGHAGNAVQRGKGKTPLIPMQIAKTLFVYAESILGRADTLLDRRDAGEISWTQNRALMTVRDACFYLLGALTGMRCEEIVGIEIGAGRTEVKDDATYHWVKSIEHKTGKGPVEYLMPLLGHEILRITERWSSPYRELVRRELAALEALPASVHSDEILEKIRDARANQNRLFLGYLHGDVRALGGSYCGHRMRSFAKDAGVDWALAPHQLRRLYAKTFVSHRLGTLLFLKEQFKHSSLSMTQLYAANPSQDTELYDMILDELHRQKVEIMQGWIEKDEPLAGGAGRKIMRMRAHDFPNRAALIDETADKISVRATGHAWCLAQDDGCGGQGLYERSRCGGCGNGVIDQTFVPVWREIYSQQRELLDEVKDLGPGAAERVKRDLHRAEQVLKDLGIEPETGDSNDESDIG